LHFNGETWVLNLKPKAQKKKAISGTHNESAEILAPMPGKILRLQVSVNESVQADQVVIVMEAMKMEYSLRAPFAGKVSEIHCKVSQQVELGEALLFITQQKKQD
jgi:biotin carboxyl carrier protein